MVSLMFDLFVKCALEKWCLGLLIISETSLKFLCNVCLLGLYIVIAIFLSQLNLINNRIVH